MTLSVKTISTDQRRVLDKMALGNNAQVMHHAVKDDLLG
jgi:DNA-binding NarL/FixJ family response regulator